MGQLKGEVMWFNNAKGFGFLKHDGGPDVFVHHTAIVADGYRSLKEGEKVSFEIVTGEKGPQAANVTMLPGAEAPPASIAPSSGSADAIAYA